MGVPVHELKKKKDNLLATFRINLKKHVSSKKSGAGAEEVYEPIWPFYDVMAKFLTDVYLPTSLMNSEENTYGATSMSGNRSQQVPMVPNQQLHYAAGYPTATTPHREPYPHQGAPGFQQNCGALAGAPAPKQQAPPQPDMSKTPTMGGIYLAGPGAQHRQQMGSYPYQTQQAHAPRVPHQRPAFFHGNPIANSTSMMFNQMMTGQMSVSQSPNATVVPAAPYPHRPAGPYYPNAAMGVIPSQGYLPYQYSQYYYSAAPVASAGAAAVRGPGAAPLGPPGGAAGAVSLPPASSSVQAMSTHIPIPGTLTQPTPLQTNFGQVMKTKARRKHAFTIVDPATGLDFTSPT